MVKVTTVHQSESKIELNLLPSLPERMYSIRYIPAVEIARKQHRPVLIHVDEMTQPQGHSTSGSHERYKSKDRLKWEADYDCILKMREWILKYAIADQEELDSIEKEAQERVRKLQKAAWQEFLNPIKEEVKETVLKFFTKKSDYSRTITRVVLRVKPEYEIRQVFLDPPHHFSEFSPFSHFIKVREIEIDISRKYQKSDGGVPKIPV